MVEASPFGGMIGASGAPAARSGLRKDSEESKVVLLEVPSKLSLCCVPSLLTVTNSIELDEPTIQ